MPARFLSVTKTSPLPAWQQALILLSGTVVSAVIVASLYWAQTIFIPLALAIFLTFLLAPLVTALQRRKLGRTPSVLVVALVTALACGGGGWIVARQVVGLAEELPEYSGNIRKKIKSLRELTHGTGPSRWGRMVEDLSGELHGTPPPEKAPPTATLPSSVPSAPTERPGASSESPAWLSRLTTVLGSVVESLGGLALALVLLVFMLLKREDLRNRLIRLIGHGRVTLTTKAVDEAAHRISRFLLMQAIVNGTYGLVLTIGLLLIGVSYALLWGFLAAILRYIPYIGAWMAALPIIVLSLAMFEGWQRPLLVIGLIVLIELISNNIMEPRLYGQSMGVSEVALLISAAFWGFLWGPVGMVLSSPLTVCLVVLGKYVPQLGFLAVLLGDEPPLEPHVHFYQRLLARDQDEATELALTRAQAEPAEELYDALLVPALNYARRDRDRDDLSEADELFILNATREIIDDLGASQTSLAKMPVDQSDEARKSPTAHRLVALGYPVRDLTDQLGLEMLRQLLDPAKWDLQISGTDTLTAELLEQVAEKKPALICIGSIPPGGLARTRSLCKRLRARFPKLKILVGRWGPADLEPSAVSVEEAGADDVATTLLETRNQFSAWLPVLAQEESKTVEPSAISDRPPIAC
jgi:predicted PurR-regulated permease PerM